MQLCLLSSDSIPGRVDFIDQMEKENGWDT